MDLLEQLMVLHRIAADADDFNPLVNQFLHVVAEAASLFRAAAGQIGRVEIDHEDFLAHVIRRLPLFVLIVGADKFGGRIARFQAHGFVLRQGAARTHQARAQDEGCPSHLSKGVHAMFLHRVLSQIHCRTLGKHSEESKKGNSRD